MLNLLWNNQYFSFRPPEISYHYFLFIIKSFDVIEIYVTRSTQEFLSNRIYVIAISYEKTQVLLRICKFKMFMSIALAAKLEKFKFWME